MKKVIEEFGDDCWWCEICAAPTPPGWPMCGICKDNLSKADENTAHISRKGGTAAPLKWREPVT